MTNRLDVSYILPIYKSSREGAEELGAYLGWLRGLAEVVVVDASPPEVYEAHAAWDVDVHVPPSPDLRVLNGKAWGVLTGLELASNDRVIIADDDVRYDADSLLGVARLLDTADVVRPQNYFDPLPWHAHWDTGRVLLNRMTGGDWPGTLGVRRSRLGTGYQRDCLFENLQMVRSVVAAGGREVVADGVYVRRIPPTAKHFLSQRVRQAYDEWARPWRFLVQLALLPAVMALAVVRPRMLVALGAAAIAMAEAGRRKAGGSVYFSTWSAFMAPLWILERMVCAWLALGARTVLGGVRYHGVLIREPASSMAELARMQTRLGGDAQ